MIATYSYPPKSEWPRLLERPAEPAAQLEAQVKAILAQVRNEGDAGLRALTEKFDGFCPAELLVSAAELEAGNAIPEELKAAIQLAAANIRKFHAA